MWAIFDFITRNGNATTTYRIRLVPLEGNPWFVAADACRACSSYVKANGEVNTSMAIQALGADEVRTIPTKRIGGWEGKHIAAVSLISESGLYKLIMRSDKPQARVFQEWVTREVLPTIPQRHRRLQDRRLRPSGCRPGGRGGGHGGR